jgi:hypothetical protein
MLLGDGPSYLQADSAAQLEGLPLLSINVYMTGFVSAQLFFGTWLFPLAYLAYKSELLPRFLRVLLALDGVGVLIWFLRPRVPRLRGLLPAVPDRGRHPARDEAAAVGGARAVRQIGAPGKGLIHGRRSSRSDG